MVLKDAGSGFEKFVSVVMLASLQEATHFVLGFGMITADGLSAVEVFDNGVGDGFTATSGVGGRVHSQLSHAIQSEIQKIVQLSEGEVECRESGRKDRVSDRLNGRRNQTSSTQE